MSEVSGDKKFRNFVLTRGAAICCLDMVGAPVVPPYGPTTGTFSLSSGPPA